MQCMRAVHTAACAASRPCVELAPHGPLHALSRCVLFVLLVLCTPISIACAFSSQ